jgi:hypothetical protein
MKSISLFQYVSFFLIVVSMSSCHKKSSDDSSTPATPMGTLGFHLHTNVDSLEVDSLGEEYTLHYGTHAGRSIVVTQAHVLISNIQLIKADGSVYTVPNAMVHMMQGEEVYVVGEVPVGNYKSLSYQIGLDTSANATIPTPSNTLLYDSSVWFTNTPSSVPHTGGYVFVHFQGKVDTSTAKDGSGLTPFDYKIGTTGNLKRITLPNTEPFTITEKSIHYAHMIINYAALLEGVVLTNPSNLRVQTATDNKLPLATTMVGNMQAGGYKQTQYFVSYEE